MKNHRSACRQLVRAAWVAVLAFTSACSLENITTRTWTEDVLLEDGSTIVVRRSSTVKDSSSWSGDASNSVERDATLEFTGALAHLPKWQAPLRALLLYQDQQANEWVLVATTTSCDRWMEFGGSRVMYLPDRPETMYWEYRLGSSGWIRQSISRSSIGKPTNLFFRNLKRMTSSHMPIAQRQQLQSDPSIVKRFVSILERPEVSCDLTQKIRETWTAEDARDGVKSTFKGLKYGN